jgi:hypothetical protein
LSESAATPHLTRYLTKPGQVGARVVPTFLATATEEAPTKARVKVPEGDYYLVLDHSEAWGKTTPSEDALPARVDYLIQTGEPHAK